MIYVIFILIKPATPSFPVWRHLCSFLSLVFFQLFSQIWLLSVCFFKNMEETSPLRVIQWHLVELWFPNFFTCKLIKQSTVNMWLLVWGVRLQYVFFFFSFVVVLILFSLMHWCDSPYQYWHWYWPDQVYRMSTIWLTHFQMSVSILISFSGQRFGYLLCSFCHSSVKVRQPGKIKGWVFNHFLVSADSAQRSHF